MITISLSYISRPLREEELLTSRIHQYPSPESGLLEKKTKIPKSKTKSTDKDAADKPSKKRKEKKSKQKTVDLMLPEVTKIDVEEGLLIDDVSKTNGKNTSKGSDGADDEMTLVEPHAKGKKTEKHKKSKKESKDKESKRNKSSKKGINMSLYRNPNHFTFVVSAL